MNCRHSGLCAWVGRVHAEVLDTISGYCAGLPRSAPVVFQLSSISRILGLNYPSVTLTRFFFIFGLEFLGVFNLASVVSHLRPGQLVSHFNFHILYFTRKCIKHCQVSLANASSIKNAGPLFEGEDKLSKQWAVRHRSCTQPTDVQAVQHCHEYQPGLCFFEFTDRADT